MDFHVELLAQLLVAAAAPQVRYSKSLATSEEGLQALAEASHRIAVGRELP